MKPWTNQETEQAIELLKTGLSYSKVAEKMGRTKGSVIGRIQRADQSFVITEKRDRRVRKLFAKGIAVKDIAKQMNLPVATVSKALPKRNALPFPGLPNRCKFPLWSPPQRTGLVCGDPSLPGKAYCMNCHKIVYRQHNSIRTKCDTGKTTG